MFCPATTPVGPFLVMERSACATTVVLTVLELFEGLGSLVADETVALSDTIPPVTGAVIENVSMGSVVTPRGPGAVQVIVPPLTAPHIQPLPAPLAPVTPAGSVSTTVIGPVAGSRPLFPTLIV